MFFLSSLSILQWLFLKTFIEAQLNDDHDGHGKTFQNFLIHVIDQVAAFIFQELGLVVLYVINRQNSW